MNTKSMEYKRRDSVIASLCNGLLRLASKRYRMMVDGSIRQGLRSIARDSQFHSIEQIVRVGAQPFYEEYAKRAATKYSIPMNPEEIDDLVYEILKATDSIPEGLPPNDVRT